MRLSARDSHWDLKPDIWTNKRYGMNVLEIFIGILKQMRGQLKEKIFRARDSHWDLKLKHRKNGLFSCGSELSPLGFETRKQLFRIRTFFGYKLSHWDLKLHRISAMNLPVGI